MRNKRILLVLLAPLLFVNLISCDETKQDDAPLTMYVGLGNNDETYLKSLHQAILDNTNIDVQYVFNNTMDTSTAVANHIKNYALPADIVVTAARTNEDDQVNSFLDLAKYTNVPDNFSISVLNNCQIDGGIYQLPFASRLIGIEYNKTLLEEKGWKLPTNFEEYVALKEQVEQDSDHYKFAVSGGVATGHGFNYLFNVVGTNYLITPDGDEWLKKYRNGESKIDEFAAQCDYFQEFTKAGLFGHLHDTNWNADVEFSRERALFYFNTINNIYSYNGFRYTSDGKIYGAEYIGDEPKLIEDPNGNAVYYNNEYVLYDENNEKMQGYPRYNIPGSVVLSDTYASMPWISENGSSNCYVSYDNMHIALDKKLAKPQYKNKLTNAEKVLKFLATQEAADIYNKTIKDGYIATKTFEIDDTRLYYDFKDQINRGYTMPWYYNSFDNPTIVAVGEQVNAYVKNKGTSPEFSKVLDTLDKCNDDYVHHIDSGIALVEETLSIEQTATLEAISGALAVQSSLKSETVNVSLIPYVEDVKNLPISKSLPAVQETLFAGQLLESEVSSIVSTYTSSPIAIKMTGQEINNLINNGYNCQEDYGVDLTFKYKMVTKNNAALDPNSEYVVAIDKRALLKSFATELEEKGRILKLESDVTLQQGIKLFAELHPIINTEELVW